MKITKAGNTFTIVLDGNATPVPSASGKSHVLASTHGNQPFALADGSTAYVGINIYTK